MGGGRLHYRLLPLLEAIVKHPRCEFGIATCKGEKNCVPLLRRLLQKTFGDEAWVWYDDEVPHRLIHQDYGAVYLWAGDFGWELRASRGRDRYTKRCDKIWDSLPRYNIENTICLDTDPDNI